jgi:hypothetical protein
MWENVQQGLFGFILVAAQWLSPGGQKPELKIADIKPDSSGYEISCKMDLAWNKQMEQLVDAGVPLRFKILSVTDTGDSTLFFRTLEFNVVDYTYTFTDSTVSKVKKSKKYPLVLLALKNFSKWKVLAPKSANQCRIDAILLPSRVSRLNRTVDMSMIWGQKKVSQVCVLK